MTIYIDWVGREVLTEDEVDESVEDELATGDIKEDVDYILDEMCISAADVLLMDTVERESLKEKVDSELYDTIRSRILEDCEKICLD